MSRIIEEEEFCNTIYSGGVAPVTQELLTPSGPPEFTPDIL